MRLVNSLLMVLSVFILCSCGRNGDTAAKDLIYYDYIYRKDLLTFTNTKADYVCKRVCYDLGAETVVWEQENTNYPHQNYVYSDAISRGQYCSNMKFGNNLVRVFVASDYPYLPPSSAYPFTGVYLQKVDMSTGNEVSIKQLLSNADFDTKKPFAISKVETDGTRIFFECSNGYLYCYDENGGLIWKKFFSNFAQYAPVIGSQTNFAFFSLEKGRIYVSSFSPGSTNATLKCVDAATGNIIFDPGTSHELVQVPALMFNNDYIFEWGYGGVGVLSKSTGVLNTQYQGGLVPGTNGNGRRGIALGMMGDNYVTMLDNDRNFAYYDLAKDRAYTTGISCTYNLMNIISGTTLYGAGGIYGNQKFECSAINASTPATSSVLWKRSIPFAGGTGGNTGDLKDMILANGNLYLFTNFYQDNGVYTQLGTTGAVIILSTTDGNIVKQCHNVPFGNHQLAQYGWYNISKF